MFNCKIQKANLIEPLLFHRWPTEQEHDYSQTLQLAKEIFREIGVEEEIEAIVYSTQNYFLGIPYFDCQTKDGFHCKVFADSIKFIN